LPKGVSKKSTKITKPKGPKRGHNLFIAPKKPDAVNEAKISSEVSRLINRKNEDMLTERANISVGKVTKKKTKEKTN